MDNATRLLVQYAHYHRDRRNIATHYIGIPLIAFAIAALLARVQWEAAGLVISADWVVWTLVTAWYLTLGQRALTLTTAGVLALLVILAHPLGTAPLNTWLGWSLGSFVIGWVFQFVGHYWEGRKPAFVDDLRGLLIGPMFVVAELGFALGAGRALHASIEAAAGPVRRHGPAGKHQA
ncbi:MAG: DUF962 domain-containing protein [Thiobacillus sp.]|nr:DUF962 domain-containing protein [Thiobacillus sp.]MDP2020949.1 DUF962 domain-containing protein [Hydrogenophaga sp.]MDZ4294937.1 Mpo1-like protein [Hydrogenophaga sp.]